MKRTVCLLLCAAMLIGLFCGCGTGTPAGPESTGTTERNTASAQESAASDPVGPETTVPPEGTEPAPETKSAEPLPEISWSKAFRTKNVPEGSVDAESVAFLHKDGDGTLNVTNVPIREILSGQPERLPRSR